MYHETVQDLCDEEACPADPRRRSPFETVWWEAGYRAPNGKYLLYSKATGWRAVSRFSREMILLNEALRETSLIIQFFIAASIVAYCYLYVGIPIAASFMRQQGLL